MKQFYVFKDGRMQGSAATRELAIDPKLDRGMGASAAYIYILKKRP